MKTKLRIRRWADDMLKPLQGPSEAKAYNPLGTERHSRNSRVMGRDAVEKIGWVPSGRLITQLFHRHDLVAPLSPFTTSKSLNNEIGVNLQPHQRLRIRNRERQAIANELFLGKDLTLDPNH